MTFQHLRSALTAVLVSAVLLASGSDMARSQEGGDCQVVKVFGIAVLKQCANQVRSMTLSLRDIKRAPGTGPQGRFFYVCPIQHMCEDEPDLWGWFIDEKAWLAGAREEADIRDLLRGAPGIGFVPDDFAQPACAISTVEIAGLEGRAMCYEMAPNNLHVMVVVGATDDIGFALVFGLRRGGWEVLREKVSEIVPKFALQRATGDAGLLKWLR